MNFNLQGVQDVLYTAWDWTAQQAITTRNIVAEYGAAAWNFSAPYAACGIEKIQDLWQLTLPYIKMTTDFLQTNIGVAALLLGVTIVCMKLARNSADSPVPYFLWMTAGVVSAVASGALIVTTKFVVPGIV